MATWGPGMMGESVAQVQRFVQFWAKYYKLTIPASFQINGTFDAATTNLLKQIQTRAKIPATGVWDARTIQHSVALGKYFKTSEFGYLPKVNSIAEDRAYVIQQWNYLYGRNPTATELAYRTNQLQSGYQRSSWMAAMERLDATGAVTREFKATMGRDPTPTELAQFSNQIKTGRMTRTSLKAYLSGTAEFLLKTKEEAIAEGAEDQKAALEDLLDEYGLGSLKTWAWEQIKSGVSETRIIQNLRETTEYKARFPALANLGVTGRPAMTEAEYLAYERSTRQIMQRFGMPPGFYDDPEDFNALISADLSIDEIQSRVADGYNRVMQAPIEVRQAFAEMYGADGDAALASLFVDPDRAEAVLSKQTRAAEAKGWGGLFGIDLTADQAEIVAGVDLAPEQLRQGLGEISANEALFRESVSEDEDLQAGVEGVEAVFNTGGNGASELDQRRRTRLAATAGGGGANITQEGIGVGAAD